MLKSMTGYGRGRAEEDNHTATVEIRAVNHRYLNLEVSTCPEVLFLEEKTAHFLRERLGRGRIEVRLSFKTHGEPLYRVRLNRDLAHSYNRILKEMGEIFGVREISLDTLLNIPQVVETDELATCETKLWRLAREAIEKALHQLTEMRKKEGSALKQDLSLRFEKIQEFVGGVKTKLPEIKESYRQRLMERMRELALEMNTSSDKMAQQLALIVEKTDITEELTRITSHLEQFSAHLSTQIEVQTPGKKLDFILQELLREVNTLSSKTSSVEVGEKVIDIKDEIEKMREQVRNIE